MHRGRRVLSARQLETNQRNSLKSTGPRTIAGKLKSRMNAYTHGLFSKLRDFGSLDERIDLTKRLLEQWEGADIIDQTLIAEYVNCFLALQHLHRLQAGLMVIGPELTELESPFDPAVFRPGGFGWALIELRGKVKKCLLDDGCISEQLSDELSQFAPNWREGERGHLQNFRILWAIARQEGASEDRAKARDNFMETMLNDIFKPQMEELAALVFGRGSADPEEEESENLTPQLPLWQLELYMRYETMFTRKMFQALAALERRFRARKGEFMRPPTIIVKL